MKQRMEEIIIDNVRFARQIIKQSEAIDYHHLTCSVEEEGKSTKLVHNVYLVPGNAIKSWEHPHRHWAAFFLQVPLLPLDLKLKLASYLISQVGWWGCYLFDDYGCGSESLSELEAQLPEKLKPYDLFLMESEDGHYALEGLFGPSLGEQFTEKLLRESLQELWLICSGAPNCEDLDLSLVSMVLGEPTESLPALMKEISARSLDAGCLLALRLLQGYPLTYLMDEYASSGRE